MKQLTDTERLKVVMNMLTERQVDEYAVVCNVLEQDCERNGFYNVPEECEDSECNECRLCDQTKRTLDCPYMDVV